MNSFMQRFGRKTKAIAIIALAAALCSVATAATSAANEDTGPGGVRVTAQTQLKGQTDRWSAGNNAQPGSVMRMLISYQNTSTLQQANVAVRAKLANGEVVTAGTTFITNATQAKGAPANSDAVATSGINIGTYKPGANAYVVFEFTLPTADKLACGQNSLQNVGIIRLVDGTEYTSTAVTKVLRDCPAVGNPTPTVPLQSDGQSVTQNLQPAGQAPPSALAPAPKPQPQQPQAAAPIQAPSPAPTPPVAKATPSPSALPNSGPANVIGLFVGATVAGTVAHHLYLSRRRQFNG